MGYLLKDSPEVEIVNCIKYVHAGKTLIKALRTHSLLLSLNNGPKGLSNLTKHEKNFRLVALQKTKAEVADMLFISSKTISKHRTTLSKKLNLDVKQNALLKWAIKNVERLT